MNTKLLLTCLAGVILLSFQSTILKNSRIGVGKYGNCSCGDSTGGDFLSLEIKEDQTFVYRRKLKQEAVKEVKGKWKKDKNKLLLLTENKQHALPLVWKLSSRYPCIQARKNLEWTRLCTCTSNNQ